MADVRLRYDFHDCDTALLRQYVEDIMNSQTATNPEGAPRTSFPAIEHLCNVTGRPGDIDKASCAARDFLVEIHKEIR